MEATPEKYSELEGQLQNVREYDAGQLVQFELAEHSGLQFMLRNYASRHHYTKHLQALRLAQQHQRPVQVKVWQPDPADAQFHFVERVRSQTLRPLTLLCTVQQGRHEQHRLNVTRQDQVLALLRLLAEDETRADAVLLREMAESARLIMEGGARIETQ